VLTMEERLGQSTNALGRVSMYYIQCRIPGYKRNDGCNVEL
jgi:hypothetical protein